MLANLVDMSDLGLVLLISFILVACGNTADEPEKVGSQRAKSTHHTRNHGHHQHSSNLQQAHLRAIKASERTQACKHYKCLVAKLRSLFNCLRLQYLLTLRSLVTPSVGIYWPVTYRVSSHCFEQRSLMIKTM